MGRRQPLYVQTTIDRGNALKFIHVRFDSFSKKLLITKQHTINVVIPYPGHKAEFILDQSFNKFYAIPLRTSE